MKLLTTCPSLLISVLGACVPPAAAAEAAAPAALLAFGDASAALDAAELARLRGGFDTGGLTLSFGIERVVYVNGTLVTTTTLNVANVERIASGGATATLGTGALAGANLGTVVQNAIDGQKIQNLTVVNASVGGMGALRSLNLQSSLRSAVIDSLRR